MFYNNDLTQVKEAWMQNYYTTQSNLYEKKHLKMQHLTKTRRKAAVFGLVEKMKA